MSRPKVSIVLPNLNNIEYLDERFETILDQTFNDWELVVVDNYSDDGAWELISRYAEDDDRIRVSQAPRMGMYANWNNGLRLARGEYIYIATSDDTMKPECLEIMAAALDEFSECDLVHCCLECIDDSGNVIANRWLDSPRGRYFGALMDQRHIRYAPHDGILHCGIGTVYLSITQLLIRKSVFGRIGFFNNNYGSYGDFEWGMRAGLVCNTVHVPQFLATWRIHDEQATNQAHINSAAGMMALCEMIESAVGAISGNGHQIASELDLKQLTFCYRYRQLSAGIQVRDKALSRLLYLLSFVFSRTDIAKKYLEQGRSDQALDCVQFTRKLLADMGYADRIRLLQ